MKYRKKPIVIEALQLRRDTWDEMCKFVSVGKPSKYGRPREKRDGEAIDLYIPTAEGLMLASENDWIIKGVKGEFYPCKPDIFDMTYERVEG